ncbi:MAG: c-type cytochrome [Acidimicrobiia bacterium]|nr:c-type cytochrome [Acidimicrobiia bacterium]
MQEQLASISAELGVPTDLVERAARARATATGTTVEQIVAAWSGGEAAPAAAAPPAASAAAPAAAPAAAAPAAPAGPIVEIFEPTAAPPEVEVEVEPEVPEPVKRRAVPVWMMATFVAIPAVALMYALLIPNGPDCGGGGQLAIDPVTGVAQSCDGSEYGVSAVDFFAMGSDLYATQCAACHGAEGGGGAGPAFTGGAVLASFPTDQCATHVEWVALGSSAWPEATYGALDTPVGSSGGVMPGFGSRLSPEELAAVVLYERVAFGGEGIGVAEADCGLGDEAVAAGE